MYWCGRMYTKLLLMLMLSQCFRILVYMRQLKLHQKKEIPNIYSDYNEFVTFIKTDTHLQGN